MTRPSLVLLAAAALAACGGGRDASSDTAAESAAALASADSAPVAAPAPAEATAPSDQPLAVEDIDRWEKGLTAERAAIDSAARRIEQARSGADTLAAMSGLQESETAAAGASAAGVSVARYRTIAGTLSEAARAVAPPETEFPPELLTPAMREELKKGNEATLARLGASVPVPVLDALRPRAAGLRKQVLELAGLRMKVASGG